MMLYLRRSSIESSENPGLRGHSWGIAQHVSTRWRLSLPLPKLFIFSLSECRAGREAHLPGIQQLELYLSLLDLLCSLLPRCYSTHLCGRLRPNCLESYKRSSSARQSKHAPNRRRKNAESTQAYPCLCPSEKEARCWSSALSQTRQAWKISISL
jgi:hypothetical protein